MRYYLHLSLRSICRPSDQTFFGEGASPPSGPDRIRWLSRPSRQVGIGALVPALSIEPDPPGQLGLTGRYRRVTETTPTIGKGFRHDLDCRSSRGSDQDLWSW